MIEIPFDTGIFPRKDDYTALAQRRISPIFYSGDVSSLTVIAGIYYWVGGDSLNMGIIKAKDS
mgnify:CR=1 FL=1